MESPPPEVSRVYLTIINRFQSWVCREFSECFAASMFVCEALKRGETRDVGGPAMEFVNVAWNVL